VTIVALVAGLAWIAFEINQELQPDPRERPVIARDLPSNFRDAEIVFKERVRSMFRIESSEQTLVSELQRQGFKRQPSSPALYFEQRSFPCRLVWIVAWKADRDRLTAIDPGFTQHCL
jgi:hypothetical protein